MNPADVCLDLVSRVRRSTRWCGDGVDIRGFRTEINGRGRPWTFICKLPVGQIKKACPALFEKIFGFSENANQPISFAVPSQQRGGSRSSRTRGGMRWPQQCRHAAWLQGDPFGDREQLTACRRTMLTRTAKSCGPDASTLASSFAETFCAQPGCNAPLSARRRWQTSRSPGRARNKP
ncbi:hypothetical protein SAMN05443248_3238 [Bradyrhizobium erythrophlei]|uniref:Uncharacterized protein n=1 Tax=Bradyrhizobium erythrophlei TaxID=1437360 RepID=A0A1M5P662_9BRAD|nr:hypothetical protein SAMN05443248_3238 [Bradyrhizobium erythrophlei]